MTSPADKHSTARPGDEICPSSYRKKPVIIQAIRWCGTNLKEVIDFTGLHPSANKWTWEEYRAVVERDGFKIFTLEGAHMVTVGDYVIRGVAGEFYACKPDIFWMTYERESVAAVSERGEPSEEVARLKEALRRVKSWVVGEKIPNWADDTTTYLSRGKIADICDIALAHPHHPRDLHPSIEARPAERD